MRSTDSCVINTQNSIPQEKQTGHEAVEGIEIALSTRDHIILFCLSVLDGAAVVTGMLIAKKCSGPLQRR